MRESRKHCSVNFLFYCKINENGKNKQTKRHLCSLLMEVQISWLQNTVFRSQQKVKRNNLVWICLFKH